jgi:NADH-quinone oxidoreductase subunit J
MVLFLFVVMLLNVPTEETPIGRQARLLGGVGPRRFGALLSAALALELFWALGRLGAIAMPAAGTPETSVKAIGLRLFRDYAFAFEATSVLILVAMVGAVILARKEPQQ